MKCTIFAPFALVLGAMCVTACGSQQQPAANPRPDAPEGISITEGRLVLPAVKGNPGAVYFTVHNDSDKQEMIRAAHVDGAQEAKIHQMATLSGKPDMQELTQIAVPAKGELVFEPGKLHVMAMMLDDKLQKGGTTDVTLTFAGGDKATFPAEILAAGDAR